jgi:hypothetical protein
LLLSKNTLKGVELGGDEGCWEAMKAPKNNEKMLKVLR